MNTYTDIVCSGPATTYNNQPAPGPYPAFPPVHMEPGFVYTLETGPCFVGAGTCVAGSEYPLCLLFSFLQAFSGSD
jgi:hypothetical protein